jgi:two-component system, NarL family, invasion response regulator UvrY
VEDDVAVRVLIVDDQEPFRSVAREVVEAAGDFEVVGEAATGEESVDLARALRPDLVLMDVNLPGIDGAEATRRILAEATASKVVLLSTYEEDELAERAQECGASAYVPKSAFDPDRLTSVWSAI